MRGSIKNDREGLPFDLNFGTLIFQDKRNKLSQMLATRAKMHFIQEFPDSGCL